MNEEPKVGNDRETSPGPEPVKSEQNAGTNGRRTSDPDLARRAERAELSDEAERLEYDPAAEEG
ncbi:hypothetical protein [Pseudonocardia sp. MH-G8]|uniref:hypothetical protein n=1 Tax=Pseudonocardia sp. MH-G8 TaxID=1854588 RepID=UPI0011798F6B|nr:hypothetical protein [Pseudonocardia sp. MH-G8]